MSTAVVMALAVPVMLLWFVTGALRKPEETLKRVLIQVPVMLL